MTALCLIKRNATRWTSTFEMLERFLHIEGQAKQIDAVDTIRRPDSERIRSVLPTLAEFKNVMTELQTKGTHIGEVRGIFHLMLEDFSELKDYIGAGAAISHFLKQKSFLWNAEMVSKAMKSRDGEGATIDVLQ
ncbi:hypothetical protein P3T76_008026 [Phytophthora citrophthora]|uniref:Uncharacterized protein n=1 Tax=Phytophthora citrophthora TaxID=4793 RepID=A0AAD9GLE0_9STRA|nr:hypothetical protein P3T76_008026 [Phytophthora citrophthora]